MRDIKIKYIYSNGIDTFSRVFTLEGIANQLHLDEISDSVALREYKIIAKCEYTCLQDENDVEIYEGDYLLDSHSGSYGEVKFVKGAFIVEFDNEIQDLYDWTCECVIGNIYENKL